MSANQQQERQFDAAAEQAMIEGSSSFGVISKTWTAKQIEKYEKAAKSRGVRFIIADKTALFFV